MSLFTEFGWPEFWITLGIILVIVGVREYHHFFKPGQHDKPNSQTNE